MSLISLWPAFSQQPERAEARPSYLPLRRLGLWLCRQHHCFPHDHRSRIGRILQRPSWINAIARIATEPDQLGRVAGFGGRPGVRWSWPGWVSYGTVMLLASLVPIGHRQRIVIRPKAEMQR